MEGLSINVSPRVFYTLSDAAAHWNCAVADIAGWAAAGKLRIMTGIGLVRCGDTVVAGQVTVSPMEVLPLLRRCGTGPAVATVRRVPGGPGASSPYDWEGMIIALFVRVFDHGLPASQTELVAEMQEWFADHSDGKKMPDSRSIRRGTTPIWKALKREGA